MPKLVVEKIPLNCVFWGEGGSYYFLEILSRRDHWYSGINIFGIHPENIFDFYKPMLSLKIDSWRLIIAHNVLTTLFTRIITDFIQYKYLHDLCQIDSENTQPAYFFI